MAPVTPERGHLNRIRALEAMIREATRSYQAECGLRTPYVLGRDNTLLQRLRTLVDARDAVTTEMEALTRGRSFLE